MSTAVEVIFLGLLAYFLVLNALYLGVTAVALIQLHLQRGRSYIELGRLSASAATLPVSIVVPAYNEAAILRDSVTALLALTYPEFEVIVVNDGSSDSTLATAIRDFALEPQDVFHPTPLGTARVRGVFRSRRHPRLWVIDKENGGWADALNAGLNLARYPFVAHVDADCYLETDSLLRLMRPINFAPDETIIVAATIRVANGLEIRDGQIASVSLPRSLVERFQLVEYLSAFVLNRLGWSALNSIPVVSGAGGVWPKRVLMELGGFSTKVTHADIEVTLHAHAMLRARGVPYRIINAPDATIWTQVPMTWHDLKVQRKRWQRVVFEMLWKYRCVILNPRYDYFGMVCMPYLLVYEGLGPFIEAFSYAFVVVLAVLGWLSLKAAVVFMCFSFGMTAVIRILSLLADVVYFKSHTRRSLLTLSATAFLEPLVYHLAVLGHRMLALLEFLRGRRTHETMVRKAIAGDIPAGLDRVASEQSPVGQ